MKVQCQSKNGVYRRIFVCVCFQTEYWRLLVRSCNLIADNNGQRATEYTTTITQRKQWQKYIVTLSSRSPNFTMPRNYGPFRMLNAQHFNFCKHKHNRESSLCKIINFTIIFFNSFLFVSYEKRKLNFVFPPSTDLYAIIVFTLFRRFKSKHSRLLIIDSMFCYSNSKNCFCLFVVVYLEKKGLYLSQFTSARFVLLIPNF